MRVVELVEALKSLPPNADVAEMWEVACEHCRAVFVATDWDENGDPIIHGWRKRLDTGRVYVCSAECADAMGKEAMLRGESRPRWRMMFHEAPPGA